MAADTSALFDQDLLDDILTELGDTCTVRKRLYTPVISDRELYWGFNGTANDYSGNARDGVLSSPPPFLDDNAFFGKSFEFGRSSAADYVEQTGFLTGGDGDFTVSLHISPGGLGDFYREFSTADADPKLVMSTAVSANETRVVVLIVDDDGNTLLNVTSDPISISMWNHILFRASSGTAALLINGELDPNSFNYTSEALATTSMRVSGATPFVGSIDEVQVFSRSLTDAEVAELASWPARDSVGRFASTSFFDITGVLVHDTHIFGGGNRSGVEDVSAPAEGARQDNIFILPIAADVQETDTIIFDQEEWEIRIIQNAGGADHHFQVFARVKR